MSVAGDDQNVALKSVATLDGTASSDSDGDLLTYSWTFDALPSGSAATLKGAKTPTPTFTADVAGAYVAKLVVNDGTVTSKADTVTVTASAGNSAPVANAGADQNVSARNSVALDGSASSDADGDTLSYSWSFTSRPSGSAAVLSDPSAASPSFTADIDGGYVVELTVNDGTVKSQPDQMTITATTGNSAPVADAGPDQNVSAGDAVSLDGSASSDADSDTLTYAWQFVSVPGGSSSTLSDTDTVSPKFNADIAGDYVIGLIVNDGSVDSAMDRVLISAAVGNAAPVANAGPDQNVNTGDTIDLDGTGSSDADGDEISYMWSLVSQPMGSSAVLHDATAPNPAFTADIDGDYVVQLVVDDGEASSPAARVSVTAVTANSAPVANAGPDQNVDTGVMATLDGNGSTDANDDTLSYQWTFVSTPSGSTASLTNTTSATSAFTPDVDGTYVVELVVNDGSVDSAADRVKIIATTANSAPNADAGPDQSVAINADVTLDGSASNDNDDDSLTYEWSFVSKPSGSSASLSDATTDSPSFTADQAGSYVIGLIVNDGTVNSTSDRVTVTAKVPDLKGVPTSGSGTFHVTQIPPPSEYVLNQRFDSGTFEQVITPFELTAVGADFTIQNLEAMDRNGVVNPRFDGISDGMVIPEGQTITFNLVTPRTNGRTVNLLFTFSEDRNGEQFRYTYRGSTN